MLDCYWTDSNLWKNILYGDQCIQCGLPMGEQKWRWLLKKDFKQTAKHPFVGFEGLGGFTFCGKELAGQIKEEFGIGHLEVLIGDKGKVSENLVQLNIPLAPYPLSLDTNEYGKPFEDNKKISCSICNQHILTNQTLDFFPPFEKGFEFDICLTQEWFGWFRRIVVSRRFMGFCFDRKILKNWDHEGVVVPQK